MWNLHILTHVNARKHVHGCIAYVHMQKSSASQFQRLPTHTKKKVSTNKLLDNIKICIKIKTRQNHKYNVPCSIKKHSQRNGWKFLARLELNKKNIRKDATMFRNIFVNEYFQ